VLWEELAGLRLGDVVMGVDGVCVRGVQSVIDAALSSQFPTSHHISSHVMIFEFFGGTVAREGRVWVVVARDIGIMRDPPPCLAPNVHPNIIHFLW